MANTFPVFIQLINTNFSSDNATNYTSNDESKYHHKHVRPPLFLEYHNIFS